MGTTVTNIREWINRGRARGATHLIVACDGWDHEDYPVFVGADQDVREEEKRIRESSMQSIMEVYWLACDEAGIRRQLATERAYVYNQQDLEKLP